MPDDRVDAVLPFLSRQLRAVVQLQRLTGMRSGEVLSMRTGDLDMSGETWEYAPARHKTKHHGKRRRIFLGPLARGRSCDPGFESTLPTISSDPLKPRPIANPRGGPTGGRR